MIDMRDDCEIPDVLLNLNSPNDMLNRRLYAANDFIVKSTRPHLLILSVARQPLSFSSEARSGTKGLGLGTGADLALLAGG